MRTSSPACLILLAVAVAACEAPTAPAPLAPGDRLASRASGAGAAVDPADFDDNGNGVVCVKTVPASGRAAAGERIIAKDDDGAGGCPGGFESADLALPTTIAAGTTHACALDGTGGAWCWGTSPFGALGVVGVTQSLVPVEVQGAPPLTAITAGFHITCGLDVAGSAWCWGSNSHGQLGSGDPLTPFSEVPAQVAGGVTFASIDAGETHTCGIEPGGQLHCWGSNLRGGLGATTVETCAGGPCASAPIPSAAGLLFDSFDAGLLSSCGLATDGLAYCWGWDDFHQGGDGVAATGTVPTPMATPPTFASIASGTVGGCGLDDAGAAWCWGAYGLNYGWIGNGAFSPSPTPSAVVGGHTFEAIASSDANNIFWFQCGIDDSAAAWCWGSSYYGQLGTDDPIDVCPDFGGDPHPCSATPVAVEGELEWTELELGTGFVCGRTTEDAIYCWGNNALGALGDGTTTSRPVPAPVSFGAPAAFAADFAADRAAPDAAAFGAVPGDTRVLKD